MTKLKQLVLVTLASLAFIMMTGVAKADAQQVINNLASAPVKLHNHIQMEVEKAKEYQKNSWADAKAQLLRLKAKFIKN
tara:strand:+ start:267 stop:503 length:237 start_codon:yes stop_codon:yes gene_type:complete